MIRLPWRSRPEAPEATRLKVIAALGNPGAEYATTRHNVGWWLADRLAEEWGLGRFKRDGNAAVASGRIGGDVVRILKPLTYMNRSGTVLSPLTRLNAFDVARDLLVVVDDVALEPGRSRLRPSGSPGGHNGLKSVEWALGTQDYPRLRVGVGSPLPGSDMADWVLGSPSDEELEAILEPFPALVAGVRLWLDEGLEAAMNQLNRSS